jgi:hypothetical protein
MQDATIAAVALGVLVHAGGFLPLDGLAERGGKTYQTARAK